MLEQHLEIPKMNLKNTFETRDLKKETLDYLFFFRFTIFNNKKRKHTSTHQHMQGIRFSELKMVKKLSGQTQLGPSV